MTVKHEDNVKVEGVKNETPQNNLVPKKEGILTRIRQNRPLMIVIILVVVAILTGGAAYLIILQGSVYTEKAQIMAPIISLGPSTPGVIDKFYVAQGDRVRENQVLAKVGDESIRAMTDGIVIDIQNNPGQLATPQTAVVTMFDPSELRLIGQVEEDKGLSDVRVGQRVVFTADAFGSKQYEGIVDSISPSSRSSDIVFSISDQRAEQEFDVKVKFNVEDYPELKNGMSAKMWIYK